MTGGQFWYDADGNPIDIDEAERLLSRDRIVARDTINGLLVSTVHLVLDHNLTCAGPPLIYETAVFAPPGTDGAVLWRTPTRHAALAVHDQVCAAARDGVPIDDVLTEYR